MRTHTKENTSVQDITQPPIAPCAVHLISNTKPKYKPNLQTQPCPYTDVQINEEEIGKLPEKEFRIMIVKMIKNLENKMEKMQESINKDLEELKNKYTNNKITEIKTTLEGINSRISEGEKRISEQED